MFSLINRTVDYSLHSLLGFDIHKIPLARFAEQEPSLTLLTSLYTTSTPVLALAKKDKNNVFQVNGKSRIEEVAQNVESLLTLNNYDIKINPIKVYAIDEDLDEIISSDQLSILKDKHVFLESPDMVSSIDLYSFVFELQAKNLMPILCYPEKELYLNSKSQRILKLKDRGCGFNVDLLSFTGYFGQEAKKLANILLQNNQIHFISLQIQHLDFIHQNKGIRISRKIADLLDEQLFVSEGISDEVN